MVSAWDFDEMYELVGDYDSPEQRQMQSLFQDYEARDLQSNSLDELKFSWADGIQWSARLDMTTEEIVMQARIPNKSYLSIGFGENMRGTDMILWRWKDDVTQVDNMYSTGYFQPPSDGTRYLKTTIETSRDGMFKTFTTRRALDTGNPKDFAIQPDKEIVMCYAYRTGNGDFV